MQPDADALVGRCEPSLARQYRQPGAVARVVEQAGIPEPTLKRRFTAATGMSLIDYVQNLRIEEASATQTTRS